MGLIVFSEDQDEGIGPVNIVSLYSLVGVAVLLIFAALLLHECRLYMYALF